MSLITDQFFYSALRDHPQVKEVTEGRIFNPARPDIDEKEDKIPYIIIRHEGTTTQWLSKDGDRTDTDTISLTVVAEDREALGNMATLIRSILDSALELVEDDPMGVGGAITDYSFAAGAVNYDPDKPCCYQDLTYTCETINAY